MHAKQKESELLPKSNSGKLYIMDRVVFPDQRTLPNLTDTATLCR
jgi:hypothetical protein